MSQSPVAIQKCWVCHSQEVKQNVFLWASQSFFCMFQEEVHWVLAEAHCNVVWRNIAGIRRETKANQLSCAALLSVPTCQVLCLHLKRRLSLKVKSCPPFFCAAERSLCSSPHEGKHRLWLPLHSAGRDTPVVIWTFSSHPSGKKKSSLVLGLFIELAGKTHFGYSAAGEMECEASYGWIKTAVSICYIYQAWQ